MISDTATSKVAIPIPSGEGQNKISMARGVGGDGPPVAIPIPSGEGQNDPFTYE